MKTKSKISGHIVRSGAWAVFLSVAFIALTSAFNSPNAWDKSASATGGYDRMAKSPSQPRTFSFVERVAYQRAIEDVYWHHRIWPRNGGENPDRKPALDAVMSQAQLENKVAGYLRDSLALEDYWQRPITAEQLQAEMDRMARDTKQPEVLRELFEALGNDPAVIAECLARPILAERLIADLSAQGQTRHVESPQTDALRAMSVATTSGQVVYTLPEIAEVGNLPCTDQWGATTTTNAPQAREGQTAVWTGSEMIVWGGSNPPTNTGGRYNPSTDSWTATSTTNAPSARSGHTAVWTGSEMIVWGGIGDPFPTYFNSGGRYNPSTDSWTATSTNNAPAGRFFHTAIWTGNAMVIWGGSTQTTNFNTGGRYNPSTDTWTATSTTNAPAGRFFHTAVWTDSEMIIWGGTQDYSNDFNTGGRYNPSTDSWTAISIANAPTARYLHTAVWTDSEMIVWGGHANDPYGRDLDTGGIYNPGRDSWTATSTTNAPVAREFHTAVWTGRIMIVWGGAQSGTWFNTGGRYDPGTNTWTATSMTNAPTARIDHTAIWTGSEMIVWGGYYGNALNTGGRYCGQYTPTPTPTPTAPPLTIIQPNGGEVWLMGSTHDIKWASPDLTQSDRLIIQYSRDGGATWLRIAKDVPALSSSYSWHVDNFPTTQSRVKIFLQGNQSITDQSDANFTVQAPTPTLTITQPNGGEVWVAGSVHQIEWEGANLQQSDHLIIQYSRDGGASWFRVAKDIPALSFSYSWPVDNYPTTQGRVKILLQENLSITDQSDANFTVQRGP